MHVNIHSATQHNNTTQNHNLLHKEKFHNWQDITEGTHFVNHEILHASKNFQGFFYPCDAWVTTTYRKHVMCTRL